MKLRTSFVTNSSSSSFVLIVTKDIHETVMTMLSDYEKFVISKLLSSNDNFAGIDCVVFSQYDSQGCGTFEYLEEDEDWSDFKEEKEKESLYDVFDKYETLVKEEIKKSGNENKTIEVREDW